MTESETLWKQITEIIEGSHYPHEGQDVFLFGAGLNGILQIPLLKKDLNIHAICDNDVNKHSTADGKGLISGIPCISPKELSKYPDKFVLVSSIKHYQSISEELKAQGIPYCNVDMYVMHRYLKSFYNVFQLLDEMSKQVYAGVLLCRLTGDNDSIEQYCTDQQYFCFPKFRYINPNDIFVDCGAFVGDIVEKVVENSVGLFRKIYAFEPNEKSFKVLEKRVFYLKEIWALSEGKIVCEKKGVGNKNTYSDFRKDAANLANISIVDDVNEGDIQIVTLDSYFSETSNERITFIKSDIEGFEWNMLHGAEKILLRDKPNLAISIYHSVFDYFRIALYLKNLIPEYNFSIRHHRNSFDETILYCYL